MDNISLVTTALEYYDTNNQRYLGMFDDVRYIKFIKAMTDMDHNVIIYFDKNRDEIFRSRYELIGEYHTNSNIWIWAWAMPYNKKNNTNIVRKIWNYGATLDPSVKYLKTELITSRFRVADLIQLDIHVSIASYLSKNPLIYKHIVYNDQKSNYDAGLFEIRRKKKSLQPEIENQSSDNESPHYITYYMFLLDFKELEKKHIKTTDELSSCEFDDET